MSLIPNGTPQLIILGVDDRSTDQPVPTAVSRPTHLPLVHIFAQRATPGVRFIGSDAASVYGVDSFDPTKKYFNGGSAYLRGFLNEGNACMVECIIPQDAAIAKVRLNVELLEAELPIYERGLDGALVYENNAPIETGDTVAGYKARFFYSPVPKDGQPGTFGVGVSAAGTWTEDGKTSQILPLVDFTESAFGQDGDNTGVRFFAPVQGSQEIGVDQQLLLRDRIYPFAFSVGRKADEFSNPRGVYSLTGVQTSLFSFMPRAMATRTREKIGFAENVVQKYNRRGKTNLPDVTGVLANVAVYQTNIELVLGKLMDAEKAYLEDNPLLETFYDFSNDGKDERFLMNLFGATTFRNYPYHTYKVEAAADGYLPTSQQWGMFTGGADGEMTHESYAKGVVASIAEYADRYSPRQDDAIRIESIYYDPGLPFDYKIKLLDLLAIRKDFGLALSVYENGAPRGTAADNYATAAALRAAAALYPDSVHFGTGVSRVFIMGHSGTLPEDDTNDRYGALYIAAMKSARYMGASNRRWKKSATPTSWPGNIVTEMGDIDIDYSPLDQRIANWDIGLNWIENFDVNQKQMGAWRSVYQDDTSILTGWIHNMAIIEIYKVCQIVHKRTKGNDEMTNAQFARRVDEEIAAELRGVFGDRYRIDSTTTFTDADIRRNNSWSTRVRLGANGAKGVMTAHVEAYRMDEFPEDGAVVV